MENFVGLCTFCEFHGPAVVMMTQPLRGEPSATLQRRPVSPLVNVDRLEAQTATTAHHHQLVVCDEFVPEFSPASEETLFGKEFLTKNLPELTTVDGCEGCWSLGPCNEAIFSTQKDIATSYVSTQNGFGPVSNLARDAAVKSISCEVLPNRTGHLLFTNHPMGTVVSQTFLLKDRQARGFQRFFSIVIGHRERGHALRSLAHLQQGVQAVIDLLCNKCSETHQRELEAFPIKKDLSYKYERSVRNEPSRNLTQLASDPSVFRLLHKQFSSLLRQLERQWVDTPLSGQPVKGCVEFHESRILLLTEILQNVPTCCAKVLMYCLLAGLALEIRCKARRAARLVADALSIVLPNNKSRDATYFANVILSESSVATSEVDYTLEVTLNGRRCGARPGFNYSFRSRKCTCGGAGDGHPDTSRRVEQLQAAGGAADICNDCSVASCSVAVGRLVSIISSSSLNTATLHTKIFAVVEAILNDAKAWAKLKSGPVRRTFISKLGLAVSDAPILTFFQMFLS